jgi:predicted nuclease of restriction endonuclease-like (RecB) superfamily
MIDAPDGYPAWIAEVKQRIHAARQRASLAVHRELVGLYWSIGRDILDRQQRAGWGAGIVDQVAADLRAAFPEMKGFSRSNLMYMRAFAEAWPDPEAFVQQPVGQLPWGHHLVLLTRLKDPPLRLAYAHRAVAHGWSRAVLVHHLEARTVERTGQALDNFDRTLPAPISDLARESLKDPYRFDFLGIGPEASEREVERALTEQISAFLVELGAGFAYVGKQVPLEVDGRDFFLDLLFYHVRLHCYVVVELKAGEFAPEHAGKLNFYLSAVDTQLRTPPDGPTIGLLLCKTRSRVFAEYALRDTNKPMGIAEYQLARALPTELAANLPSIARIEAELAQLGAADGAEEEP